MGTLRPTLTPHGPSTGLLALTGCGTVRLGDSLWTAVGDSVHAHLLVERQSAFDQRSRVFRQEGRWLDSR